MEFKDDWGKDLGDKVETMHHLNLMKKQFQQMQKDESKFLDAVHLSQHLWDVVDSLDMLKVLYYVEAVWVVMFDKDKTSYQIIKKSMTHADAYIETTYNHNMCFESEEEAETFARITIKEKNHGET